MKLKRFGRGSAIWPQGDGRGRSVVLLSNGQRLKIRRAAPAAEAPPAPDRAETGFVSRRHLAPARRRDLEEAIRAGEWIDEDEFGLRPARDRKKPTLLLTHSMRVGDGRR